MTNFTDTTRHQELAQSSTGKAATFTIDLDPENYLLTTLVMKDLDRDLATDEYAEVGHVAKESCRQLARKAAATVASDPALKMSAASEEDKSIELVIDRKGNPKCLYFTIFPEGGLVRIYVVEGSTVIKKQFKAAYAPVEMLLFWLKS